MWKTFRCHTMWFMYNTYLKLDFPHLMHSHPSQMADDDNSCASSLEITAHHIRQMLNMKWWNMTYYIPLPIGYQSIHQFRFTFIDCHGTIYFVILVTQEIELIVCPLNHMRECEVIWLEKHHRWVNHSLFFSQLQFSLYQRTLYPRHG